MDHKNFCACSAAWMASICADARPLIESSAARATILGGVAGNGTDDNKRAGPALGSCGAVFAGAVPGLMDGDGAMRAAVAAADEPESEAPCAADIMRGGVPGGSVAAGRSVRASPRK